MTWPQKKTMKKTNTETKTMTKTNTFRELHQRAILETYDLWDIWPEWWGDMSWPKKKTITKTNMKTKTMTYLVTCDIWDTNYNSDNWEPEFMPIFVAWQLRVTLDSIRNSCDVFILAFPNSPEAFLFWRLNCTLVYFTKTCLWWRKKWLNPLCKWPFTLK